MTQIDGFEIPVELIDYLVNQTDVDVLLMQARQDKTLAQGFQPVKANIGHFRSRIRKRIEGQHELSEDMQSLLARAGFNYCFVVVLSSRVLSLFFSDLLTVFGREVFLSGLLMDNREKVRKLAIDYLKDEKQIRPPDAGDIAAARTRLTDNLDKFLDAMAIFFNHEMSIDIPSVNAESSDKLQKAEAQIHTLNAELRQIRADAKKSRTLQKKIDTRDEQINQLKAENLALQASLQDAQDAYKQEKILRQKSNEEQQYLEKSVGALILKGIEDEKQTLMNTWLRNPLKTTQGMEVVSTVPALLTQADRILSRQAETDKHSGNLRVINQQIEKLGQAYQQVCDAGRDALNPLPELQQIQEQLLRKMGELQSFLPIKQKSEVDFVDLLTMRISAAASENELVDMLIFLGHVEEYKLVDHENLQQLYIAYQRKMAALYAASWPNVIQGPIPTDPILKLRKFIAENRAFLWLLDGCNIMFGLDGVWHGNHEPAQIRTQVIDQVAGLVKLADRCLVRIYFDSPERMDITCAPNVKIVYSGGGDADQRADNAVLTFLEYARNENDAIPIFLTTDDREFSRQAQKMNVDIIRLKPFAALLADAVPRVAEN